jgi:hypothetical protein
MEGRDRGDTVVPLGGEAMSPTVKIETDSRSVGAREACSDATERWLCLSKRMLLRPDDYNGLTGEAGRARTRVVSSVEHAQFQHVQHRMRDSLTLVSSK